MPLRLSPQDDAPVGNHGIPVRGLKLNAAQWRLLQTGRCGKPRNPRQGTETLRFGLWLGRFGQGLWETTESPSGD